MPQANAAASWTGPSSLFSREASAFFGSLDSGHRCWCDRYLYEPVKGKGGQFQQKYFEFSAIHLGRFLPYLLQSFGRLRLLNRLGECFK
nr:unnamed protein product [Digitaria exilis]